MPGLTDNTLLKLLQKEAEVYAQAQKESQDNDTKPVIMTLLKRQGILLSRYNDYLSQLDQLLNFYKEVLSQLEKEGDAAGPVRSNFKQSIKRIYEIMAQPLPVQEDEVECYKTKQLKSIQQDYQCALNSLNDYFNKNYQLGICDPLTRKIANVLDKPDSEDPYAYEAWQQSKQYYDDLLTKNVNLKAQINEYDDQQVNYAWLLEANYYQHRLNFSVNGQDKACQDWSVDNFEQLVNAFQSVAIALEGFVYKKNQNDDHASAKLNIAEQLRHNLMRYLTDNDYSKAKLSQFLTDTLKGETQSLFQRNSRLKALLKQARDELVKILPETKPVYALSQFSEKIKKPLTQLLTVSHQLARKDIRVHSEQSFENIKAYIDEQNQQIRDQLYATNQQLQIKDNYLAGFYKQFPHFLNNILPTNRAWENLSQYQKDRLVQVIIKAQQDNNLTSKNQDAIERLLTYMQGDTKRALDETWRNEQDKGNQPGIYEYWPKLDQSELSSQVNQSLQQLNHNAEQTILSNIHHHFANNQQHYDSELAQKAQAYTQAFCQYSEQAIDDDSIKIEVRRLSSLGTDSSESLSSTSRSPATETTPNEQSTQNYRSNNDHLLQSTHHSNLIQIAIGQALTQYQGQFREQAQKAGEDLDSWMVKHKADYKKLYNAHQQSKTPKDIGGLMSWVLNNVKESWRNQSKHYSLQVAMMSALNQQIGPKQLAFGAFKTPFHKQKTPAKPESDYEKKAKRTRSMPEILKNYFKKTYLGDQFIGQSHSIVDNVVDVVYGHLYKEGNTWQKGRIRSNRNEDKASKIFDSLAALLRDHQNNTRQITESVKQALQDRKRGKINSDDYFTGVSGLVEQLAQHTGFFKCCSCKEASTAKQLREKLEHEDNVAPSIN